MAVRLAHCAGTWRSERGGRQGGADSERSAGSSWVPGGIAYTPRAARPSTTHPPPPSPLASGTSHSCTRVVRGSGQASPNTLPSESQVAAGGRDGGGKHVVGRPQQQPCMRTPAAKPQSLQPHGLLPRPTAGRCTVRKQAAGLLTANLLVGTSGAELVHLQRRSRQRPCIYAQNNALPPSHRPILSSNRVAEPAASPLLRTWALVS